MWFFCTSSVVVGSPSCRNTANSPFSQSLPDTSTRKWSPDLMLPVVPVIVASRITPTM